MDYAVAAGLLARLAMPFGLDGMLWKLMGEGVEWMIAVAVWVAALPGAVGRMPAFGTGPLLACTAGLVVVCLLRSLLRWSGAVMIALATLWALRTPLPDVLIAPSGDVIAVRAADGRLAFIKKGSDGFAIKEWLGADADARIPADPTLAQGVTCDPVGCVARLLNGAIVALALSPEAFEEDCRRAILVVSSRTAPPDCAAHVIDRTVRQRSGAIALRRVGDGWESTVGRPETQSRPWAHPRNTAQATASETPAATRPPAARDATPKPADLGPED